MESTSRYNSLLYSRQFIAGPRVPSVPQSWGLKRFGSRMFVSYHPSLTVTSASEEGREVLCLGHIFDPYNPSHSNEDILKAVLERSTTFQDFETAIEHLAGRWILFIRINGRARMYPDAAGTKSAFYTTGTVNEELWIGSQPRLLSDVLDLTIDKEILEDFFKHTVGNTWPGELTPYTNVRQLLPNHYLDFDSGQVVRFWPCAELPHYELDMAANIMRDTLSNILGGLSCRRRVAMPLTGGYDTRVLLASSETVRKDVTFCTAADPLTPYHDVSIPRRLMRQFGLNGQIIRTQKFERAFYSVYRRNVANMLWEPGCIRIYTAGRFAHDWFVVSGNVAEITRCGYLYRRTERPPNIAAEQLAEKSGYGGNPVAIRSFAKWLLDVPRGINIDIYDLCYWEHRIGNWLAMVLTGWDTVCEVIPVYNCRKVLEAGLGVDRELREEPYRLFRRICELCDPEMVEIPFNDSVPSRMSKLINKYVHEGITRRVRWGRLKLAGFDPYLDRHPTVAGILEDECER